jgi:glycosyltransferase involved in cell wall biosynthesis
MNEILNVDPKKFYVLEHPNFTAHLFPRIQAVEKVSSSYSQTFTTDDKIFLMFGNIASYKGILETVEIFTNLPENNKLLIVGGLKKGNWEYFKKILDISLNSNNIKIIDKVIPENDVPIFFNLSDYVIFNYKQVLTSGGIVLALNYDKKILAPALGCIPEIVNSNILLFNKPGPGNDTLLNLLRSL